MGQTPSKKVNFFGVWSRASDEKHFGYVSGRINSFTKRFEAKFTLSKIPPEAPLKRYEKRADDSWRGEYFETAGYVAI